MGLSPDKKSAEPSSPLWRGAVRKKNAIVQYGAPHEHAASGPSVFVAWAGKIAPRAAAKPLFIGDASARVKTMVRDDGGTQSVVVSVLADESSPFKNARTELRGAIDGKTAYLEGIVLSFTGVRDGHSVLLLEEFLKITKSFGAEQLMVRSTSIPMMLVMLRTLSGDAIMRK